MCVSKVNSSRRRKVALGLLLCHSTMTVSTLGAFMGGFCLSSKTKNLTFLEKKQASIAPVWMSPPTDNRDEDSNGENINNNNDDYEERTRKKYERAVKKAQLQAEIDALLDDDEDLIVDLKAEMEKVDAIAPAPAFSEEDARIAMESQEAEDVLFDAIEAQDYEEASKLKRKLDIMHVDDCGHVLNQNTLFYKAFSKRNFAAMSDLWLHDATVTCIHPSSPTLIGASAVLSSFEKLLHQPSHENSQKSQVRLDPNHVRLHVRGNMAIVTCEEHVYQKKSFVRGKKSTMELVNKFIATNVYRKVQNKWYMVHHHATWHPDTLASKKATKVSQENQSIPTSSSKRKLSPSNDEDNMTTESILGLPPSTEGLSSDASKKRPDGISGEPGSGPVRRVFMGSLGDLLNGGLNDILSGADDDDEDDDDDIEEHVKEALLHFEDDEDDDEDDIDDDMDIDDDIDVDEPINIVSRWPNTDKKQNIKKPKVIRKAIKITGGTANASMMKDAMAKDSSSEGDKKNILLPSNVVDTAQPPKDILRQNCIAALRRLAKTGEISGKQKRMLLTDIITCSAKGEFSMVEVAYELLCGEISAQKSTNDDSSGESDDDDLRAEAEEDFAEQCRVFAMGMPEYPAMSPQFPDNNN